MAVNPESNQRGKEGEQPPAPDALGGAAVLLGGEKKILGEKQAKQARPRLVTSQRLPLPRFSSVQLGMEYCAYFITTTVWRKPKPDEEEMRESGARGWPPRQLILTDDVG